MIWNKNTSDNTDMGLVPCDWVKLIKDSKPNYDPNPIVGKCHKCGLELRRVMMYSCSKSDCPCFSQISM